MHLPSHIASLNLLAPSPTPNPSPFRTLYPGPINGDASGDLDAHGQAGDDTFLEESLKQHLDLWINADFKWSDDAGEVGGSGSVASGSGSQSQIQGGYKGDAAIALGEQVQEFQNRGEKKDQEEEEDDGGLMRYYLSKVKGGRERNVLLDQRLGLDDASKPPSPESQLQTQTQTSSAATTSNTSQQPQPPTDLASFLTQYSSFLSSSTPSLDPVSAPPQGQQGGVNNNASQGEEGIITEGSVVHEQLNAHLAQFFAQRNLGGVGDQVENSSHSQSITQNQSHSNSHSHSQAQSQPQSQPRGRIQPPPPTPVITAKPSPADHSQSHEQSQSQAQAAAAQNMMALLSSAFPSAFSNGNGNASVPGTPMMNNYHPHVHVQGGQTPQLGGQAHLPPSRPHHPMRQQSMPNVWEQFPGGGGSGLAHPSQVSLFNGNGGYQQPMNNASGSGSGSGSAGIFPPSIHAPSGTSVMDLEVLSNQSASGSEKATPQIPAQQYPTRSASIAVPPSSNGMTLKQAHANAIIAGQPIDFGIDDEINLVDVADIEVKPAAGPGPASKKRKTAADEAEEKEEAARMDIERRYAAGEKITPEEDKRRRNTAASARFRLKKKERERAMEMKAKELETKLERMEREMESLRKENGWLKALVINGAPQPFSGPSMTPASLEAFVQAEVAAGMHNIGAGAKRKRLD